jgi:hypothetical protein
MLLRRLLLLVLLGCQIILPLRSVAGQNSAERVITDRINFILLQKRSVKSGKERT